MLTQAATILLALVSTTHAIAVPHGRFVKIQRRANLRREVPQVRFAAAISERQLTFFAGALSRAIFDNCSGFFKPEQPWRDCGCRLRPAWQRWSVLPSPRRTLVLKSFTSKLPLLGPMGSTPIAFSKV